MRAFGPRDALDALPLRDFGLARPRLERRGEQFKPYPTIVVASTDGDSPEHRARAGPSGAAARPAGRQIPELRNLLTDTAAGRWAQVILWLGQAQPTARTPRRRLADVLAVMP